MVEAQTEVPQWGRPGGGTVLGHQGRAGGTQHHLSAQHQSGEKPFLTFEVVSLVPYDRNLIDISLLSPEQVPGVCGRRAEQEHGAEVQGR